MNETIEDLIVPCKFLLVIFYLSAKFVIDIKYLNTKPIEKQNVNLKERTGKKNHLSFPFLNC